jgi:Sulfatase
VNKAYHPFLFAIYPILFLYSQNIDEFSPDVLLGPILVSVSFTLAMSVLIWKFSKNRLRGAFLLSLFLLVFFSYGHFYHFLEVSRLLGFSILGEQKFALSLYGLLFAVLTFFSYKKIRDWPKSTVFLNVLGLSLVSLTLIGIVSNYKIGERLKVETSPPTEHGVEKGAPDIFYIILDGYPRQDVLHEIHQFDNSQFLAFLKTKNFRILGNSHSNYPGTSLSLASSLNLNYIDQLIPAEQRRSDNRWLLKDLIQRNYVLKFLKERGYVTAAFDSGYFHTELKNVDHFYATGWFLNEFHEALLDTTPAWVVFKNIGRYQMQRRRILYVLDHLPDPTDATKPVFVFAHIMALHPPFVFGPNGEERSPQSSSLQFWKDFGDPSIKELSRQYQDQLTYINKRMQSTVQAILENRKRPVLIILQGDHGSSFLSTEQGSSFYQERFSILNAIHVSQETPLYDSMSPVNTFRVIFNSFFGTTYKRLEDRSFYSLRNTPYQWEDVTEQTKKSSTKE